MTTTVNTSYQIQNLSFATISTHDSAYLQLISREENFSLKRY
jgi:hypothetical protein